MQYKSSINRITHKTKPFSSWWHSVKFNCFIFLIRTFFQAFRHAERQTDTVQHREREIHCTHTQGDIHWTYNFNLLAPRIDDIFKQRNHLFFLSSCHTLLGSGNFRHWSGLFKLWHYNTARNTQLWTYMEAR